MFKYLARIEVKPEISDKQFKMKFTIPKNTPLAAAGNTDTLEVVDDISISMEIQEVEPEKVFVLFKHKGSRFRFNNFFKDVMTQSLG